MHSALNAITTRWSSPNGYKTVLSLSLPLIITTSSGSLQSFIDRMFLAQYASDALAATVTASLVTLTLAAVFIGIASYVGVFVAQYHGAKETRQIAPMVWQGCYTLFPALLVLIPVYIFMDTLFHWVGHEPLIQRMEVDYARIVTLTIPLVIVSASLSGFFAGIGRTSVVMWSNLLITVVNLVLDYALIFGHWGFPRLGVAGAGWATFVALAVGAALQALIFLKPYYRDYYGSHQHWQPNLARFKRLLHFGFPLGLQSQMESLAATLFVLLIGQMGTLALTAHSIAMNILLVALMPMLGISIAVSVLVGQRIGDQSPDAAADITWSATHIALAFFIAVGLCLVAFPTWFIAPYTEGMSAADQHILLPLVRQLLSMVALFCLFDAVSMMMSGALKGAGDTRFVAWVGIALSWLVLVLPTWLNLHFWGGGLLLSWGFFVAYGVLMCGIFSRRFQRGRWRTQSLLSD